VIENNTLITGVPASLSRTPGTPNGIVTGFQLHPALMNDPAAVGPSWCRTTTSKCTDRVQWLHGIVVLAGFSHVEGNTISSIPPPVRSGVLSAVRMERVLRNRNLGCGVTPSGSTPLPACLRAQSTPLPLEIIISGFGGFSGHYLFRAGSRGNTVVGNSGTALDLGTNNRATGQAPVKGGVGDRRGPTRSVPGPTELNIARWPPLLLRLGRGQANSAHEVVEARIGAERFQ